MIFFTPFLILNKCYNINIIWTFDFMVFWTYKNAIKELFSQLQSLERKKKNAAMIKLLRSSFFLTNHYPIFFLTIQSTPSMPKPKNVTNGFVNSPVHGYCFFELELGLLACWLLNSSRVSDDWGKSFFTGTAAPSFSFSFVNPTNLYSLLKVNVNG